MEPTPTAAGPRRRRHPAARSRVVAGALSAVLAVSPETLGLIGRALEGARVTGGRYDPTVLGDVLRTGYDRSFEEVGAAGTAGGADGLLVDDHGRLHPSGGFARFLAGDGAEPEVSG